MNRRLFLFSGAACAIGLASSTLPALAQKVTTRMSAKEIEALLAGHNKARADVGVKPVVWSDKLAAYAQNWAQKLASTGTFTHSGGNFGENLAQGDSVEVALNMWLTEKPNYNGGTISNQNLMDSGHYTQIVWRDTKRIGCGKAKTGDSFIWVCSYDPPGNYLGEKAY
jgi:pathogenesis-related protein 1